eukprot:5764769-Pyramimonas_sp.AAC.1
MGLSGPRFASRSWRAQLDERQTGWPKIGMVKPATGRPSPTGSVAIAEFQGAALARRALAPKIG